MRWALPSNGKHREIIPTVLGERWRFSSQLSLVFPRISKIILIFDTESCSIRDRKILLHR